MTWIDSVPPLDFDHYIEAYENVAWHCHIVPRKIARTIRSDFQGKKSKINNDKEFNLKDSKMSAWVAFRSSRICRDSFDHMNKYVRDSRIHPLIKSYSNINKIIENKYL